VPLFPYQNVGVEFLTRRRCALLADEMGLGKTIQAITAADELLADRLLIVTPAIARWNWANELKKFSAYPRPVQVVTSLSEPIALDKSVIISYDLAVSMNIPGSFDALIADEAHYLKSVGSQRSQAVLGKDGLVRRARRFWALTGTPLLTHAADLWPLLYTFGATPLRYPQFLERYCVTSNFGIPPGKPPRPIGTKRAMVPELRKIAAPYLLRRKKVDVLPELPPVLESDWPVERKPFELSKVMLDQVQFELEALDKAFAATSLPLDQQWRLLEASAKSVSTLRRYIGLQKSQRAIDLVKEEMGKLYRKIVIFAVHVDVVGMLRVGLSKFNPVVITGACHADLRQDIVDRFQQDPNCCVFIGNIVAAGTSITLTESNNVLFVEKEWTPALNEQALARCHRIGQRHSVNVRSLVVKDSIDEKINAILRRKSGDIASFLD
jgi:SWI/SNF-related matrix-associated actin-dependent regulator 1 of chromatin subfamily A